MAIQFDQLLDGTKQAALAEEIISATVAVVSNASAPDFALQTLEQGFSSKLPADQHAAATAMQAYAVGCAKEVLTPALDALAVERADKLKNDLEKKCLAEDLSALSETPEVAMEFKRTMCRSIASKCAELTAAEMDRLKKGKITILNEQDQKMFDQQHEAHQEKQRKAAIEFLSSLPQRYPSFGKTLFDDIRQHVQRDIEERYRSPDIHARIDMLFKDAFAAMTSDRRTGSAHLP